jgi:hypothetical protein
MKSVCSKEGREVCGLYVSLAGCKPDGEVETGNGNGGYDCGLEVSYLVGGAGTPLAKASKPNKALKREVVEGPGGG